MSFPRGIRNRRYKTLDREYIYDGAKWIYYEEPERAEMTLAADIPLEIRESDKTTMALDASTLDPLDGGVTP